MLINDVHVTSHMEYQIYADLTELKDSHALDMKVLNDNVRHCFNKCSELHVKLDDGFAKIDHFHDNVKAVNDSFCPFFSKTTNLLSFAGKGRRRSANIGHRNARR